MFGSHEVVCNKPDGYYFLPLFAGSDRSSHWAVAIIYYFIIIIRYKRGHICDSLGTSTHKDIIHTKINELFQGTNGRFEWNTCPARQQSEMECGPRIINSIHDTLTSISRNEESLENVILEATLMTRPEEEYDAAKIREKAADIISRFLPSMWTNPIRVDRNRETGRKTNNPADDHIIRKKKRRRTRQKNTTSSSTPTPPSLIILSE